MAPWVGVSGMIQADQSTEFISSSALYICNLPTCCVQNGMGKWCNHIGGSESFIESKNGMYYAFAQSTVPIIYAFCLLQLFLLAMPLPYKWDDR